MEQVAQRILTFCIACVLAVGVLATPLRGNAATWDGGGEPSTPSLGSSSLEDLLRRLENREPEITLTDHVEVDGNITIAANYNAPVTIHMGDYGIRVLEGTNLHLSGPITFTGNGDTVPLFRLERCAVLVDYMGDASIVATGDDAVALSVGPGAHMFCPDQEIRTTGSGSTALETQGDTLLEGLRITADHPDGIAISADGDLRLNFCTVSGKIDVAGDLTLDLTIASPLPENVRIVKRRASWYYNDINMHVFGYCAIAGETAPLPDAIDLEFHDVDGIETLKTRKSIPVQWETGELDLSQPGNYTVYGTPQMHSPPGLEGVERTGIEVWIVEPGTPWFTGIGFYNSYRVTLDYLQPIEDAQELRMYYSPDGEDWELLDEDQASFDEWGVSIYDLQREQLHYLQLEVIGGSFAGRSNILYFWLDENGDTGTGGTRDGTGQGGGEDPGPPPDEGNGNGGGTDEGNLGSGNTDSGRTNSGSSSSTNRDKPDADAIIPVFGAAEPIAEETPPLQPVEDPAATTLTAPQLSTLLEVNPGQLTFQKNGMTVIVPSELLAALAIREESLTVSMGMDGVNGFHISIFSGDEEIISFNGQAFQLWVPYEVDLETLEYLYIVDQTGAEQFADDYVDGRLLFHLTHTGSYTILDNQNDEEAALETVAVNQQLPSQEEPLPVPEEPAEDGGRFPILPIAVALTAILVVGGDVLLRKRGGKRRDSTTQ